MSPRPSPVIIVAGLGRCGTSLAMQMLAAGGVPTVGEFPDFEDMNCTAERLPAPWLAGHAGKALKVLNPHACRLPLEIDVPTRIIWLDRDPRHQARSQAKFAHLMADLPYPDRHHMRRWRAGLAGERQAALRALRGRAILTTTFERLLLHPTYAACEMADLVADAGLPRPDPHAMARAVRPRPSACAPGLAMELALVGEGGR